MDDLTYKLNPLKETSFHIKLIHGLQRIAIQYDTGEHRPGSYMQMDLGHPTWLLDVKADDF